MARASEDWGPSETPNHDIPTTTKYFSYARSLVGGQVDGVVRKTNVWNPSDLKVSANGGNTLTVQPGEARVMGVWYSNSLAFTVPLPANTSSRARTDLIVVRVDHHDDGFQASVGYLVGVGAPTRNFGTVWDLPLALVTVPPNSTVVAASAIEDVRHFLAPSTTTSYAGQMDAKAYIGGLQIREPGRVYVAKSDETWERVYPPPDPDWNYLNYTSEYRDWIVGNGADYYRGAYTRFADGTVRLRGRVESAAGSSPANSVIARLPVGYRPAAHMSWRVDGSASNGSRVIVCGESNPTDTGKIRLEDGLPTGGWVDLSVINFWSGQVV